MSPSYSILDKFYNPVCMVGYCRFIQFLDEGTTRSCLGLDLISKADSQPVQTINRGFSPWQPLRCETARCFGETGFSFSANVAVFLQILSSACQGMMLSMLL